MQYSEYYWGLTTVADHAMTMMLELSSESLSIQPAAVANYNGTFNAKLAAQSQTEDDASMHSTFAPAGQHSAAPPVELHWYQPT
jgi:hypothetical protein